MCLPKTQSPRPESALMQTPLLSSALTSPSPAVAPDSSAFNPTITVGAPQYDPVRYHQGAQHTDLSPNYVHTSKCDNCDRRNDTVLQQCNKDGFNICKKCMYGPPEDRKDGGIHYAPESDLDWSRWDQGATRTPRQSHPKAPKKKFATIVGRGSRRSKVQSESLQSSSGGEWKSLGDHSTGGKNDENDELFVPDNLATSDAEGGDYMAVAPNPLRRHIIRFKVKRIVEVGPETPAEGAGLGFQNDGLHAAKKNVSFRDADNEYNGGGAVLRGSLKRKAVTISNPDSLKRVRFGKPNGEPGANKEPSVQGNHVANKGVAEIDPDITGGKYDIQLSVGKEIFRSGPEDMPRSIHRGSAEDSVLAHDPTTPGTRTRVQRQILDFLTHNPGELNSATLASYRDLLRQETTRVEKALGLLEDAELLLGLRMPRVLKLN